MTNVWLIRPPKGRDVKNLILGGVVPVDVGVREDVSGHLTRAEMLEEVRNALPSLSLAKATSRANNLYSLVHEVKSGDVVCCLTDKSSVILGLARGENEFSTLGLPAIRMNDATEILTSGFDEDIKNGFRTHVAVSLLRARDGYERLRTIMGGRIDPGVGADHEESIRIGSRLEAYELADIVAELLSVDGYKCRVSPPGPDGGVDIYAGKGLLGLSDSLLVQVKSGKQVATGPQVYQILGNMVDCCSNATLFVSWSGFTQEAIRISLKNPFKSVLWDGKKLIELILKNKDNVSDSLLLKLKLSN